MTTIKISKKKFIDKSNNSLTRLSTLTADGNLQRGLSS